MLVLGKPVDQYKMLPWMCVAIVRANADSREFVELDGCKFKRMFVAFGACLMPSFWEVRKCCSWMVRI